MTSAFSDLSTVERFAAEGRHAEVVSFIDGLRNAPRALDESPTLSLHFGIAHARLGRFDEGERWVALALQRARERGDRAIALRALNVAGAIALDSGRVDEASHHFRRALTEALDLGDHATVGRCANNLGIIASMRGDHAGAIGSYTIAQAAFQRAGHRRGLAEIHHNLAIAYREQGQLELAFAEAERAIDAARDAGNRELAAQALAERAEIRAVMGDATMARREAEAAVTVHRELGDVVMEAEDLRVVALAWAASGEIEEPARLLRDVIERAHAHGRPLLAAKAERDLARILAHAGKDDEARELAAVASEGFAKLGAVGERDKLEQWVAGWRVQQHR